MCLSENSDVSNCANAPITLQAGALKLLFDNGTIRSIRFGEKEIVRRIYMALRDQHWNTVPYSITNLHIEQGDASFSVTFDAKHALKNLLFNWHGTITGSADNTITLYMDGTVERTFMRNRIGWCVLHPLTLCKGSACVITTSDGATERRAFPDTTIAPNQLFSNIHTMKYPVSNDVSCCIIFRGDRFETEDQRNWTDASFKTYSTPLSIPHPIVVNHGDHIVQSVTVLIHKRDTPSSLPEPQMAYSAAAPLDISRLTHTMHSPPTIGIGSDNTGLPLSDMIIERIGILPFHHLRREIHAPDDLTKQFFTEIAMMCEILDSPFEAALFLSDNFREEINRSAQFIAALNIPVKMLLLFKKNETVTPPELLNYARIVFSSSTTPPVISGGTNRYFVEINRTRPAYDLDCGMHFSVNPQVHTGDDCAIMENLEGLRDCIQAAKQIASPGPVTISPLTLRPRKFPETPEKSGGADRRQQQLFCAAWLTGALCVSVMTGLDRLTCFNAIVGPEGIVSEDGSTLFPVYHLFSTGVLDAHACSALLIGQPSPRIAALFLSRIDRSTLLLANLTVSLQYIQIKGLLAPCDAACLDASSLADMGRNIDFWESRMQPLNCNNDITPISLSEYAIMRFDMPLSLSC